MFTFVSVRSLCALGLLLLACMAPCLASETLVYRHQGLERTVDLYRPTRTTDEPRPLVIALHGRGQTLESLRRWLPLQPVADREGFVIASPVAVDLRWSYGRPVIGPMPAVDGVPIDDIGFMRVLIDDLVAKKIADPSRIYVTGLSRGGLMSFTAACALADRVAAAAPLITPMTEYQRDDCNPARAIPLLVLAGTDDPSQPFKGAKWPTGRLLSVPETMYFWSKLHACTNRQARLLEHRHNDDPTRVEVATWAGCAREGAVMAYVVRGGGHRLPSLDDAPEAASRFGLRNRDFDTAETVWAFLKQFRR